MFSAERFVAPGFLPDIMQASKFSFLDRGYVLFLAGWEYPLITSSGGYTMAVFAHWYTNNPCGYI